VLEYLATATSDPDAAELLDEYFAMREHGMSGYRIVHPSPGTFTEPAGVFLVARRDGEAIGCGGIRMLDPGRAEVKHLYLRPAARGAGLGRALLNALEEHAARLGATEVVLDTNARLEAAQALYRSAGYVEVAPYNDNPNATHWFRKPLG
jgi:GNAT superfamily N-acetyltransferase